jgi:hypothetical protein
MVGDEDDTMTLREVRGIREVKDVAKSACRAHREACDSEYCYSSALSPIVRCHHVPVASRLRLQGS